MSRSKDIQALQVLISIFVTLLGDDAINTLMLETDGQIEGIPDAKPTQRVPLWVMTLGALAVSGISLLLLAKQGRPVNGVCKPLVAQNPVAQVPYRHIQSLAQLAAIYHSCAGG